MKDVGHEIPLPRSFDDSSPRSVLRNVIRVSLADPASRWADLRLSA